MYKREHTPIMSITRLQQANTQQLDLSVESQVGAAYTSVYMCVCHALTRE